MLEVASGSGEHVVHFAQACPDLIFQPSDPDPQHRASVDAWSAAVGLANVRPALALDVTAEVWPVEAADVIVCINMIHIAPWAATRALLRGASSILPAAGPLCLYGPFRVGGKHTSASNLAFDAQLKAVNPEWGVRDLDEVSSEARDVGLEFVRTLDMPANNLIVVFRKERRR